MTPAPTNHLRGLTYALLIAVAAGAAGGRILGIARVYEPYLYRATNDASSDRPPWPGQRPKPMTTLGANDRSRWNTVRSLVDEGTYAIGQRDAAAASPGNPHGDVGIIRDEGWETIDKILRPDDQRFYSSKPPLLSTLAAGEYWLLKHFLGWSITEDQPLVVRAILFTFNWLPFVAYLVVLARLAEALGKSDWGRIYVVAAGCFATFLTPFLVTLNNHTVATCSAIFAIYSMVRVWDLSGKESETPTREDEQPPAQLPFRRPFSKQIGFHALAAGLFAGWTACTELTATSFAVALLALLVVRGPKLAAPFFLFAAAIPVAAFFLTNYLAIGELAPAYSKLDSPWYQYAGSYWTNTEGQKHGIDWATEGKGLYAFHWLVGHHGLFSLSPIYLLGVAGMLRSTGKSVQTLRGRRTNENAPGSGAGRRFSLESLSDADLLGLLALVLTSVVVGFYVYTSNNYGGWTSGPRWLMWLSPLFLLAMLPAADALARSKGGRACGYVLLALSVASVSYPAWNPWRHPWLYDILDSRGWIGY
jgi:hypothetical protein